MLRKCISIVLLAPLMLAAQDHIPQTSGFSGFALTGPGYFYIESNILVKGPPLQSQVAYDQVESVLQGPQYTHAGAIAFAGELKYTFAKTRTQLFLGNKLEDLLRLDVPFGLGVRQELKKPGSIMAVSLLTTPLRVYLWEDPFVEGEDRIKTNTRIPGARWRWGGAFGTGLELTFTYRNNTLGAERSGEWLLNEGRLEPDDLKLLERNGHYYRSKILYRFESGRQRVEPHFIYHLDERNGKAVAERGYSVRCTYIYRFDKFLLDVNAGFGQRTSQDVHPIYGVTQQSQRYALSASFFMPFKKDMKGGVWLLWFNAERFVSDSNIDFYDQDFFSSLIGVMYRFRRD